MFQIIIIINNFFPYIKQFKTVEYYNTIDECKEYLINYISDNFKTLNIDFPLTLEEFEYIWFDNNRAEADAFLYTIIPLNENRDNYKLSWNEPWTLDEVYSLILDKMYIDEVNDKQDTDSDSTAYSE